MHRGGAWLQQGLASLAHVGSLQWVEGLWGPRKASGLGAQTVQGLQWLPKPAMELLRDGGEGPTWPGRTR